MKGILITGGEQPDFSLVSDLFSSAEPIYICAADSGLDYCRKNSVGPDYILGDMDSLENRSLLDDYPEDMIEEHPAEKDYTDTELGLIHLREKGCSSIVLIGGGGGRLDHIIALLSIFDRPAPPELWITANERVHFIEDRYSGNGLPGETVSLFPVGTDLCRMKSRGLKWPLDKLSWKKGDVGISNALVDKEFSITMSSGRLILIRELKSPLQPL
ncbi:MAG: thiamine diphosphokinase [Spirochaetales bacterium]|nr:thiamine diphosphokinase [Spirochaetales bacterium]